MKGHGASVLEIILFLERTESQCTCKVQKIETLSDSECNSTTNAVAVSEARTDDIIGWAMDTTHPKILYMNLYMN